MTAEAPETLRWYTRARNFPQLIGRLPNGEVIPFGPYTITQVVSAFGVLVVMSKTTGLWAHFGLLANAAIALGVFLGVLFGVGRVPLGGRSPVSVATGGVRACFAPRWGTVAGVRVMWEPAARPRARHRVWIDPAGQDSHRSAAVAAAPDAGAAVETHEADRVDVDEEVRTGPEVSAAGVVPGFDPDPTPTAPTAAPAAPPAPTSKPALTGVQALLAQSLATPDEERKP